jgi:serine/threonine protein kinase
MICSKSHPHRSIGADNAIIFIKNPQPLKTVVAKTIDVEIPRVVHPYEFIRVLGESAYSIIYLARCLTTSVDYACKVVALEVLKMETVFQNFEREVRILQTIDHANIVQLIDVVYTPDLISVTMEYCSGGDLLSIIHARGSLTLFEYRRIFEDVLFALDYLHSHNISHCGIKLENILLNEVGVAKIADFGLSHHITSTVTVFSRLRAAPLSTAHWRSSAGSSPTAGRWTFGRSAS